MIHQIKEIIEVEPFILTLRFNSGEIREVNLNDKLYEWGKTQDSPYAELRQPEEFMKVQLDENFGSIQWPNGIDLCPDVLHGISTPSEKHVNM